VLAHVIICCVILGGSMLGRCSSVAAAAGQAETKAAGTLFTLAGVHAVLVVSWTWCCWKD
jgi:hypothetical protein